LRTGLRTILSTDSLSDSHDRVYTELHPVGGISDSDSTFIGLTPKLLPGRGFIAVSTILRTVRGFGDLVVLGLNPAGRPTRIPRRLTHGHLLTHIAQDAIYFHSRAKQIGLFWKRSNEIACDEGRSFRPPLAKKSPNATAAVRPRAFVASPRFLEKQRGEDRLIITRRRSLGKYRTSIRRRIPPPLKCYSFGSQRILVHDGTATDAEAQLSPRRIVRKEK
jgi:hypothetical protein